MERNLATAERLLYKTKQLGGDDATKEVQLVIKKYGLVADIFKNINFYNIQYLSNVSL